jgi:phosphatidylinositol glycan class W
MISLMCTQLGNHSIFYFFCFADDLCYLVTFMSEFSISQINVHNIAQSNQFPPLTGYWGMYLIGVSLGYYMFLDTSSKCKSTQVVKVWVLAASFW